LNVVDRSHRGGDRFQLVLSGLPVTLLDELLNLRHPSLGGKDHRVISRCLLTEQHGSQPIQRVAWAGAGDYRAEAPKA